MVGFPKSSHISQSLNHNLYITFRVLPTMTSSDLNYLKMTSIFTNSDQYNYVVIKMSKLFVLKCFKSLC